MGKSRSNKSKSPRSNPIGSPRANGNNMDEIVDDQAVYQVLGNEVQLSASSVRSLLQQLQSASVEDRDCACNALAALVRNATDVKAALNEGAIKSKSLLSS